MDLPGNPKLFGLAQNCLFDDPEKVLGNVILPRECGSGRVKITDKRQFDFAETSTPSVGV